MDKNVGGTDRTARLVVGAILVLGAVAALAGYLAVGATIAAVGLIAGAILLVTGTAQRCPINSVAGIDTYRRP